ncbi:MAG: hypothetical protein ACTSUF_12905, partial [Candidatus Heimdallarchaeaceae archaeon]
MSNASLVDELKKKKETLIDEFKTKHPEIYTWLIENHIDLTELGKYSSSIAAALAITYSANTTVDT